MKHKPLTCKIREERPRKVKQLARCHGTRKWQMGPDPRFPNCLWCLMLIFHPTASLLRTSLTTSGSLFLGTLQNHLEEECSQAEFDADLTVEGKESGGLS